MNLGLFLTQSRGEGMRKIAWCQIPIYVGMAIAVSACNLPAGVSSVDLGATMIAATVAALQTGVAASQTAQVTVAPPPTVTLTPSVQPSPAATPVPKNPTVNTLALCWQGPGPVYAVVSSIKQGTEVEILGVGSKAGWFVIDNPTYHDRCWIEAKSLNVDPNLNVSTLKIYNPPPTPGPKETPVPTETP
jgi:hypothetical protein